MTSGVISDASLIQVGFQKMTLLPGHQIRIEPPSGKAGVKLSESCIISLNGEKHHLAEGDRIVVTNQLLVEGDLTDTGIRLPYIGDVVQINTGHVVDVDQEVGPPVVALIVSIDESRHALVLLPLFWSKEIDRDKPLPGQFELTITPDLVNRHSPGLRYIPNDWVLRTALPREMQAAIDREDYEMAAHLRNAMVTLERIG